MNCCNAIRRRRPYPPHGPLPPGLPPDRIHTGRGSCGCFCCFKERWRKAIVYIVRLAREVRAQVCDCVLKWPGTVECVRKPENQLAAFLLAWEMTGDADAWIDVQRTEQLYLGAWLLARRRFEATGETHSCAGTPG